MREIKILKIWHICQAESTAEIWDVYKPFEIDVRAVGWNPFQS